MFFHSYLTFEICTILILFVSEHQKVVLRANQAFTTMALALEEEEIEDLSTCCVCLEYYDREGHRPKVLSCSHTICLMCVEVIFFYHVQITPKICMHLSHTSKFRKLLESFFLLHALHVAKYPNSKEVLKIFLIINMLWF